MQGSSINSMFVESYSKSILSFLLLISWAFRSAEATYLNSSLQFLSMMMTSVIKKPRILCLHGKTQSGASFSNKIGGAKRKLSRQYELVFLDGPIRLEEEDDSFAWWLRDEKDGRHLYLREAMEFVTSYANNDNEPFDALLGFSQGGTLATMVAGTIPGIQAVITAGSPYVQEAMTFCDNDKGRHIPKLHFAGETDAMISIESTEKLSESGGNGELQIHEKGHLFPTKAVYVNHMLDFLNKNVLSQE